MATEQSNTSMGEPTVGAMGDETMVNDPAMGGVDENASKVSQGTAQEEL